MKQYVPAPTSHKSNANPTHDSEPERKTVEQSSVQTFRTHTPNAQSKADDLEDRLIDFAVRIIKLCALLPKTPAGKHIAGQMLRSGTSPAPNYAEARGAESHADFVHKLRIVLKELNETFVWLRILDRSELIKAVFVVRHHGREPATVQDLHRIFEDSSFAQTMTYEKLDMTN